MTSTVIKIGGLGVNTERISAAEWVGEYVSRQDALTVQAFAADLGAVKAADRQSWVDEYSRRTWETSRWRREREPMFTVDVVELIAYLSTEFAPDDSGTTSTV